LLLLGIGPLVGWPIVNIVESAGFAEIMPLTAISLPKKLPDSSMPVWVPGRIAPVRVTIHRLQDPLISIGSEVSRL
jgi:hypothetical protein